MTGVPEKKDNDALMKFLTARRGVSEVVVPKTNWAGRLTGLSILGTKPFLSAVMRIRPLRDSLLDITWQSRERIIENALAHSAAAVMPDGAEFLDVGSYESLFPFELASLGRKVTAVDLRGYHLAHPNLKVIKADIFSLPFADASFDFISAISTVEHLGLPAYGVTERPGGDAAGMAEFKRCLRPGGSLFISAPFGRPQTTWQRFYDSTSWEALVSGLEKVYLKHFIRRDRRVWEPVSPHELELIDTAGKNGADGAAAGLYRKPSA